MDNERWMKVHNSIDKYIKDHNVTEYDAYRLRTDFPMLMGLFGLVNNGIEDPMELVMSEKYKGDVSKVYADIKEGKLKV